MAENKSVKKQTFLQGAAVLAAATAIVKIIGAIYSIPLKGIIGDEGFSYFSKAYAIYEVLLMISTTGLPVAMSRMISEAQALERHDQVRKIFSTALRVFLLLGVLGTGSMLLFARPLSLVFAKTADAWFSIVCLSPAVLLICLIAAFRGFFQGQSNMMPTSVSQVFEALCKLIIGLGLAWLLLRRTGEAAYSTGGALLGVTIGLVVSAAYLWFCYRKTIRILPVGGEVSSTGQTLKTLLLLAVPITLGSAGLQIINLGDTAVYMNRLVNAVGLTAERANELSGIYEFCRKIFNLPCALGLLSLGGPIMALLGGYTGEKLELAGFLMGVLGLTVVFNSIILVTNAMMQAHGDVTTPVINMIAGGVVKVIINFVLVGMPNLHIKGVAIGTLLCYLLIVTMNILAMSRKKSIDLRSLAGLAKPLLAAVLMGAVAFMVNGFLAAYLPQKLACVAAIGAAGVVYFILVIAFRVITYDDCMLLPAGEKIARILRIRA